MVTMKDVARLAGVSLITVSRVVNNSGYVSATTRDKVEAAIDELQYVPNMVASNLRSQQSDFLALVLPDISNSFWTTIARGAEDEAWSQGYGVFICNTDNDPDKENGYIQRLIQRRIDGVMIVPTPMNSSEQQLDRLKRHGIRCVAVHRRLTNVVTNVVRSDGAGAARRLTDELITAGCERIAFVGRPFSDPSSLDRANGFREALVRAGRAVDEDLIRSGADTPETGGFRMVKDLLDRDQVPDGLLLANSRLAVGGLRAIEAAGLSIPDDITVAAFHDIRDLDSHAPQLISAMQPAYRMGQLATRLLLESDRNTDGPYREVILEPSLHIGSASSKTSSPSS
jgi:LacI family transcriptional regulator